MGRFGAVFTNVGFGGLVDVIIVGLMLYALLVALKRTRRSGLILIGIVVLGLVYLAALKFNLLLTVAILQGFFSVFLVALVVIFQEDLRYFFERVGLWWLERRLPAGRALRLPQREVGILARTLADLGRAKIGALVVIRGRDPLVRHSIGGQDVQAVLSEPLLKSIFDPHSPGHDGAVIVRGDRIDRLGVHLPLSTNLEKLANRGTRHAAALGISERSDALVLVVSEERGTISAARHGEMWLVSDIAELVNLLETFYGESIPQPEMGWWRAFFRSNNREKALALGLSVVAWIALAQNSQLVRRTFSVPVSYEQLPSNLVVSEIAPASVRVTLVGERGNFNFLRPDDIKVVLPLWDARPDHRTISISGSDVSHPKDLDVDDIQPRQVRVDVVRSPASRSGQ
jgi:diadenylate cyclase